MCRNPLFSIALVIASTLCVTSAFAQSASNIEHVRSGYSWPATSPPAFPSGGYRSSQPRSGYYQGSGINNTRVQAVVSYVQGQTCANGSCSTRSAAVPVVSSAAAPIMNPSRYSVAQYPVVMGSGVTSLSQPIHNAHYPAQTSTSYTPYTVHYGSTQALSSTPMSSCPGSVSGYGRSCR